LRLIQPTTHTQWGEPTVMAKRRPARQPYKFLKEGRRF
jgi:hypothetical protein